MNNSNNNNTVNMAEEEKRLEEGSNFIKQGTGANNSACIKRP